MIAGLVGFVGWLNLTSFIGGEEEDAPGGVAFYAEGGTERRGTGIGEGEGRRTCHPLLVLLWSLSWRRLFRMKAQLFMADDKGLLDISDFGLRTKGNKIFLYDYFFLSFFSFFLSFLTITFLLKLDDSYKIYNIIEFIISLILNKIRFTLYINF